MVKERSAELSVGSFGPDSQLCGLYGKYKQVVMAEPVGMKRAGEAREDSWALPWQGLVLSC